jgi:hypothetical protein
MKNIRFTEAKIFAILNEGEIGATIVPELCRKHGGGQSTYSWVIGRYLSSYFNHLIKVLLVDDSHI